MCNNEIATRMNWSEARYTKPQSFVSLAHLMHHGAICLCCK